MRVGCMLEGLRKDTVWVSWGFSALPLFVVTNAFISKHMVL